MDTESIISHQLFHSIERKKGSGVMKELKVSATVNELERVQAFIEEELEAAEFSMNQIMQIELAVEEIFCNIANYAYNPKEGEAVIRCNIEEKEDRVRIEFIDSGMPYNPLEREDPDITLTAEDRDIGGLGIFLTKKLMDTVEYYYESGKNVLVVMKNKK